MKNKRKQVNAGTKFNDAQYTLGGRCLPSCPNCHVNDVNDWCGNYPDGWCCTADGDPIRLEDGVNPVGPKCTSACLAAAATKSKRQRPGKVPYQPEQFNDACLVFDHYLRYLTDIAAAVSWSEQLQQRVREIKAAKAVVEALFFAQHGEKLPSVANTQPHHTNKE